MFEAADSGMTPNLTIQMCDELNRLIKLNQSKISPQQLAFWKFSYAGFTQEEICSQMQIDSANFRKIKSKLKKKLNEIFPRFYRCELDLT